MMNVRTVSVIIYLLILKEVFIVEIEGKVAVVTGASSGIGATIAQVLAREGVNVILVARREDKLKKLTEDINEKEGGEALYVVANVAKQHHVELMVQKAKKKFGKIDIYVNNAGVMLDASVRNRKVAEWEQMIDVNIKGVLYGIDAVLPDMLEQASGHIVNISSVSGKEVTKHSTVYSATKFAVRAISMGLEKELARTGVRTTNISPGMVNTSLLSEDLKNKDINKRVPLRTEDIAHAVVYAIKQPKYVNVNEITVRPL